MNIKYKVDKFLLLFTCMAIIFVTLSGCASSKWIKAGGNEVGTYYVDKTYTRKNNLGRVLTLEMTDFKTPVKEGDITYKSTAGQFEYDCQNEKRRLKYISAYSGNMAQGKTILSGPAKAGNLWQPVHPGMIDEDIMVSVCYEDPNALAEANNRAKFNEALLWSIYLKQ